MTLRALLATAGVVEIVTSRLPWETYSVSITGPTAPFEIPFGLSIDWLDRLPAIAVVLGALMVLCAAIGRRLLSVVTFAAVAFGAYFLGRWIFDPPRFIDFLGDGRFLWPSHVGFVAACFGTMVAAGMVAAPGAKATVPAPSPSDRHATEGPEGGPGQSASGRPVGGRSPFRLDPDAQRLVERARTGRRVLKAPPPTPTSWRGSFATTVSAAALRRTHAPPRAVAHDQAPALAESRRARLTKWSRSPPGIVSLAIAVAGLMSSLVFGIVGLPERGAHLQLRLDLAYVDGNELTQTTSALVLRISNSGPDAVGITGIRTGNANAYEPLPSAAFDGAKRRYRQVSSGINVYLNVGQEMSVSFSVETLARFQPEALVVELAGGGSRRIDIRPYIRSLVCASELFGRTDGCIIFARPVSMNAQTIPHLLSQGGIPGLSKRNQGEPSPTCQKATKNGLSLGTPLGRRCLKEMTKSVYEITTPGKNGKWPPHRLYEARQREILRARADATTGRELGTGATGG